MLKPIVFLLALTGIVSAATYTCACYCPTSTTYVGTVSTSTCSSSACSTACLYSSLISCTSWANSYGTCTASGWDLSSYTNALGTSAIIAAVVGSLCGLGLCIAVIVIIIIICKRKKRVRVLALQPHQQQPMMQPAFITSSYQQQWTPGMQSYPPAAPMYYGNAQYPPPYSSAQPLPIQT